MLPSGALPRARSGAWALFVLSALVGDGLACATLLGPMQEAMKADLGLSDFRLGLLQGLAASIPSALLAIPLGRLVDRASRVRMMFVLAALWSAGTTLPAVASSFELLFLARTMTGIGMLCALPVAISLGADLSRIEQRGRAMLWLSLGKIVGMAAPFAIGGWLLGVCSARVAATGEGLAPWRSVHLAFGAGSFALTLLLLTLREPARQELGEAAHAPMGTALRAIWARRMLLVPLFLGQVTVLMADVAAGAWAAPVLTRDYGLQPQEFGGWMGGVVLLSGLLGAVLGGLGADLGRKGRIPGGLLMVAVAGSIISVPAALYPVMPGAGGFGLMLFVLLLGGGVTGIVTATALTVMVPNDIRGICLGAFIVVASIIGLGVAPTLVTLISDALGGESHVREGLAIVGVGTSLLSAIGFLVAWRHTRRLPATRDATADPLPARG